MNEKEFFCSRPRLAALLLAAGFEAKSAVNPWTGNAAWLFTVSPELAAVVADYYAQIGKQLPAVLLDAIRDGERE